MAHYEDIIIDQGTDVAIVLHLVNKDGSKKNLTSYSVLSKMKLNYNSDSDDTVNFTAVVATPPTDGIVTLSLTNSQTDALKAKKRYVYDVELHHQDSDGDWYIERILEGKVEVNPSVTR